MALMPSSQSEAQFAIGEAGDYGNEAAAGEALS
jgi:hypothetical protein